MARIWYGFDHQSTSFLTAEGWVFTGTHTFSTTAGQVHAPTATYPGAVTSASLVSPNLSTSRAKSPIYTTQYRYMELYNAGTLTGTIAYGWVFYKTGTANFSVIVNTAGFIELRRGGEAGVLLATSASGMPAGANIIKIDLIAQSSGGSCTVKIGPGAGTSYVTYSGDTAAGSDGWDQFEIYKANGGPGYTDDIVLGEAADGALTYEAYIPLIVPDSNDTVAGTPSGAATVWQAISEIPPSTSQYSEHSAAATQDLVGLNNAGATPTTIGGVKTVCYAARDGTLTAVKIVVKEGATTSVGSSQTLGASGVYSPMSRYDYVSVDTGIAHTLSELNSMSVGAEFA